MPNPFIREDNAKLNKTYIFEYDGTGNITSKRESSFTLAKAEEISDFEVEDIYAYNGDLLMSKNDLTCAYTNGRPTTFLGNSVTYKEQGLIKSYKGVSITYDNGGHRTAKGSLTYTYNRDWKLVSQSDGISFIYDHNDQMIGIKNNTSTYYFRKNLQGDIISLLDSNGLVVVRYKKGLPKIIACQEFLGRGRIAIRLCF